MKWWPLIFLLMVSSSGQSRALDLKELSIDFTRYFPSGRSPLITSNGLPDRELGEKVGLSMLLTKGPLCWRNRVESVTDRDVKEGGGQFRSISWLFQMGLCFQDIDVFYHHRSEHVFDHEFTPGFPREDGAGFRLKIVGE